MDSWFAVSALSHPSAWGDDSESLISTFLFCAMSTVEDQLVAYYDDHSHQILESTGLDLAATASLPRWRKARLALAYLDRETERSTVT